MLQFISLTIAGIATYGCVYSLTAMGLVVTYKTSGIFNLAQGAVGMFAAYLYWQFTVGFGWPALLSFLLVVGVASPLLGAGIEKLMFRKMDNAGLEAKLTVTVAVMLMLMAIARSIWNPADPRDIESMFNGQKVAIGQVYVSWHQIIVVTAAVAAAIGLRYFFRLTRAGLAMRAVVDDPELTALAGARPARYAGLGWMIGSSIAATAGILIAPLIGLNILTLTLIVVNGFAAAVVGRLTNLPLTFVGGLLLGLLQAYAIGYMPIGAVWTNVGQALPMVFLIVAMLVIPQKRASLTRRVGVRAARVAGLRESVIASTVFVVVVAVVSALLSESLLTYSVRAVSLAIIMLSLVLLTGYGGQVSLCVMTFAGLGAWMMSVVGGPEGSPYGLLAATLVAAGAGMLLALPSLRLQGLYLALATLAFAVGMDNAFFNTAEVFGASLALPVARVALPGISLASDQAYLVFLCVIFSLVGVGLLSVRRSRYGRRLVAMSSSPTGVLSLGISLIGPKLAVFTVSAGLAGFGGALLGGAELVVAPKEFGFVLSLVVLLIAVLLGIRTVIGMLLGGTFIALSPMVGLLITWPRDFVQLTVGLAAIGVAQNPEGSVGASSPLQAWRERRAARRQEAQAPAEPERSLSHVGD